MEKQKGKKDPKVTAWYVSQPIDTNRTGLGGAALNDWKLLSNDNDGGRLLSFDMRSVSESTMVLVSAWHVLNF